MIDYLFNQLKAISTKLASCAGACLPIIPLRRFPLPSGRVTVRVRVRIRVRFRGLELGFRDKVRVKGYA